MLSDLEYPAVLFRILVIQRSGSMRLVKYAVISGFATVMALPGLVVANTVADSTVVDADDSVACNASVSYTHLTLPTICSV